MTGVQTCALPIYDRINKSKKALTTLDFDTLKKVETPAAKPVKTEEPTGEPSIFDEIGKAVDEALDSITKFFND